MPVIPSFTGFAQAPNLASSYLGGRASAQRDTEIAQRASQANAQLGMQAQQLAQQSQQEQMALEVKKQQIAQQALIAEQELNIKSQYQEQMARMQAEKIKTANQALQLKTAEAMRKFQFQEEYRRRSATEDPSKVAMELGPLLGMPASAYPKPQDRPVVPKWTPLPGTTDDRFGAVEIGPNRFQILDKSKHVNEDMGQENLEFRREQEANRIQQAKEKSSMERESLTARQIQSELSRLEKLNNSSTEKNMQNTYAWWAKKGDAKIPQNLKDWKVEHDRRMDKIKELETMIPALKSQDRKSDPESDLGAGEEIKPLKRAFRDSDGKVHRSAIYKDKKFIRYAD